MLTLFERFDQVEARFAKLFAAFVLLLVVSLVVADVTTTVLGYRASESLTPRQGAPDAGCMTARDGMQICDIPPPVFP